jgi:HSP20 family protein
LEENGMAAMRYEPLHLLSQLQREVNRLFDTRRISDEDESGLLATDWAPAVDIKEEDARFLIYADLPGVDPKDIEITMENGVLTLKGQRMPEKKEEIEKYRRIERVRGTFLRRFSLPETAQADKITAKSKDGVLEVVVPKGETTQTRKISVES